MEQPVWVWPRAIGPSALLIYSGRLFPHWKHNLFTGAMAAQHLNRLGFREGRVVVEERLLDRAAGRIRMVAEGPDGAIYLGTDGDGLLIRIRPASE